MARKTRGLYKRGNVWWCCYRDLTGKIVRETTRQRNYEKAVEFLTERKFNVQKAIEPEIIKNVNCTFEELSKEYLKWCVRQRSYPSKVEYIKQLNHTFGHILIKNFNTMLIEQFQTDRIQKGNRPATVNRLVATLKHAFTKAHEWGFVNESILKKVRRVKNLKENNRRLRYLSKEECRALINACDYHLKPIVITALNTGMRKEEILSLRWENVDLKHGFILLEHTKNGERREIPINETLRKTLLNIPRRIDGGYVFYDRRTDNRYLNVKRSFNSACKRAGIRNFRFHDLRHTFASHLVMAGVDLTTVSKLLGHADIKMTLRYSHLSPLHMAKAVDVLDKALSDYTEPTSHLLHNFDVLENG